MCVWSTKWQGDDLRSEWDLHNVGELVSGMGDLNGQWK